ncbi:MAG: pentapeptide repeat-containing protein [Burkholderiales bacterium]|jgi:uncharacterized protein YjbI with pentapeptide repeats|nr:pentapeptide repeat-containing protein [Burkholderiales bacterium]
MALDLKVRQPQFDMLKDAELRQKTMGEKILLIEDIAIDGGVFDNVEWKNFHFKDVDFHDRFVQKSVKNCIFENCEFYRSEFHTFDMEDVTFVNCKTKGAAVISGQGVSRNVVFKNCDFTDQPETNENYWGVVAVAGEVLYQNCKARHISVGGFEGEIKLDGCQFEDMTFYAGVASDSPQKFASLTIENCTFKKKVSLMTTNLDNLTIKNTTFETILTPETIRNSLSIENSKGNYLWFQAKNPIKKISIKNCEFSAKGEDGGTFYFWRKNGKQIQSENLTIENVKCGVGGDGSDGGMFQTGRNTHIKNIEAPRLSFMFQGDSVQIEGAKATNEATFENAPGQGKMPNVVISNFYVANLADFKGVMLPTLIIDGYKGNTLDLSDTKIGRLEIKNSRVETLLDLTNAHVGSGEFSTLSGSKKIKVITKGSNLDVKDGTLYVVPPKA